MKKDKQTQNGRLQDILLNIKQPEPHSKPEVASGAPED